MPASASASLTPARRAGPNTRSWRTFLLAGCFICGCLNMLAAGSLYVFALYAPSFTGNLGYSQTQTSTIAVVGDIGLYGVGPLSGLMADRLGPRLTSLFAGCMLGLGYGLLSMGYAQGVEKVQRGDEPTHFMVMALFLFLAGVGSSAGYMAAFTSLAKNFKRSRGIALGIPVSFFGLSAAALTGIAQSFFSLRSGDPESGKQELDTTRFLLFLGVAGVFISAISVIFMNTVPPEPTPEQLGTHPEHNTHHVPVIVQEAADAIVREAEEETPLLAGQHQQTHTVQQEPQEAEPRRPRQHDVPSISGKDFFLDPDAQMFFLVMFCLAGTGLMIINSITAMVDTVAAKEDMTRPLMGFVDLFLGGGGGGDENRTPPLASIHAKHVAFISLSSYAGRLLSGIGSDVAFHRYNAHRINVLPIATACMALAQVVGMFASLKWLYLCSILTGLAYGGFFGVAGIIVAELWGEETCGQNWGWLSWGSAIGGMAFNILFGVVMDAARPVVDGERQMCKGHGCFRWALFVSFVACMVSCLLGVVMHVRQRQGAARR